MPNLDTYMAKVQAYVDQGYDVDTAQDMADVFFSGNTQS